MSYRRTYTKTIHGSFNVSYGASEKGGTIPISVSVPIDVEVDVDTRSFDTSIGDCKSQINILTGSVVATEAAQIASKIKSAEKISDSVIDGFFGLIRSEISQQLSELKPQVDALIIELMKHRESCVSKKTQLEEDYARISERYTKIFHELDKELRNRILSLSKSAFTVQSQLNSHIIKSMSNPQIGNSVVYDKENNSLSSMMFATGLKNRALSLIRATKNYLFTEKNLSAQLKVILSPSETHSTQAIHIPVLYFESQKNADATQATIYSSENFSPFKSENFKSQLIESYSRKDANWKAMGEETRRNIDTFFQQELSKDGIEANSHATRVSEKILLLWKTNNNIQYNS